MQGKGVDLLKLPDFYQDFRFWLMLFGFAYFVRFLSIVVGFLANFVDIIKIIITSFRNATACMQGFMDIL